MRSKESSESSEALEKMEEFQEVEVCTGRAEMIERVDIVSILA